VTARIDTGQRRHGPPPRRAVLANAAGERTDDALAVGGHDIDNHGNGIAAQGVLWSFSNALPGIGYWRFLTITLYIIIYYVGKRFLVNRAGRQRISRPA
jgi:hypothetical protein